MRTIKFFSSPSTKIPYLIPLIYKFPNPISLTYKEKLRFSYIKYYRNKSDKCSEIPSCDRLMRNRVLVFYCVNHKTDKEVTVSFSRIPWLRILIPATNLICGSSVPDGKEENSSIDQSRLKPEDRQRKFFITLGA